MSCDGVLSKLTEKTRLVNSLKGIFVCLPVDGVPISIVVVVPDVTVVEVDIVGLSVGEVAVVFYDAEFNVTCTAIDTKPSRMKTLGSHAY